MSGKWHFDCAKTWHEHDPRMPVEQLSIGGRIWNGLVCRKCGCPWFEVAAKASEIVGPAGETLEKGGGH